MRDDGRIEGIPASSDFTRPRARTRRWTVLCTVRMRRLRGRTLKLWGAQVLGHPPCLADENGPWCGRSKPGSAAVEGPPRRNPVFCQSYVIRRVPACRVAIESPRSIPWMHRDQIYVGRYRPTGMRIRSRWTQAALRGRLPGSPRRCQAELACLMKGPILRAKRDPR